MCFELWAVYICSDRGVMRRPTGSIDEQGGQSETPETWLI